MIKYAPKLETAIISFVIGGFIGIVTSVFANPVPSAQQSFDASVNHYHATVGEKWTSEGNEAVFAAYWGCLR